MPLWRKNDGLEEEEEEILFTWFFRLNCKDCKFQRKIVVLFLFIHKGVLLFIFMLNVGFTLKSVRE